MKKILFTLFFSLLFADESNLTQPITSQSSYRWVEPDGKLSNSLNELIRKIESDDTIICPDRLQEEILKIKSTPHRAEYSDLLEVMGDTLQVTYYHILQHGCFDPSLFLERNYLPPHKNGPLTKNNPVMSKLYGILKKYERLGKEVRWKTIKIENILYLRKGMRHEAIPTIRERLKAEGYTVEDSNSTLFDQNLKSAVMEFQRHHGLKADGVIGPMTLAALNEPMEKKILRIKCNIERARWFLQDEDYFVFVDIPGFYMQVYDGNETPYRSKVIVGRKTRPTPQMRNMISYAVLNPYWRAPKTIIAEDILPHLKKGDFEHLEKEGIIVATDYYGKELVDPRDVDWTYFDVDNVPFVFLQKPGPKNFLGYVKFMFPNKFDVYLHDTDSRRLFKYDYRALSSGCVRVKKPIELLHLFLNRKKEIDYRDILDRLWTQETQKIGFWPKIPVYLLYLTVDMDEKGEVYFYPDIYGIDKKMMAYVSQ